MTASDFLEFGKLFKKYGHLGVFFAIRDSLQQGNSDPFYKYALACIATIVAIPSAAGFGITLFATFMIGFMVDRAWQIGEWIAENQENIEEKIKKLLSDDGLVIAEDGSFQFKIPDYLNVCPFPNNVCPFPNKETLCEIKTLFGNGEEVRSPLVVDLDGDGVENRLVGAVRWYHGINKSGKVLNMY